MARVVVTIRPEEGERAAVDAILGDDAVWLADGPDAVAAAHGCDVALSFWPRTELRQAGIGWDDLPGVRLLQTATAGLNHIGWDRLPPHVQVASAPGSSAPMVAEHVLAMLLWWTRRLGRHDAAIRAGDFRNGAPVRGLSECRVGLVGFGGIGQEVARVLMGFGVPVRAVSRSGAAVRGLDLPVATMDGLPDLLDWADTLVLCLPLVRDTIGLIDAAALEALAGPGEEGFLVNVARGPVLDEDALFDWLADPDHGAGLDVWWRYPDADDAQPAYPYHRPFHERPNVVMTPHDAPNIAGFRTRMLEQAARQLRHYLDTGEALHVQDREAHLMAVDGDGR